ncbi:MAG: hypothetical protein RLZZ384_1403 [Pseudomonadota bacterium]
MKLIYLLFLLAYSQLSLAHAPGLSSADVVLTATGVDANITFALQDIEAFSPMDSDGDADITAQEYDNAKPNIAALIANELQFILNDQVVKPVSNGDVTFDDKNNAHVKLRYEPAATHLKMVVLLLKKLPEGHKQYVTIKDVEGKSLSEKMLTQEDNAIDLDINVQHGSMFKDFLVLGIEHILTGYDHLLFLFALLMVTRNFWSAVGIITFFTIAHSITLGLAGLGVVTLSSSVIEPLIAATIIYVGLENLISTLEQEQCERVAVAIDARRGQSIADLPSILENLRKNHQVRVVFLNADTNTLVQRFSETRRRHPLSTNAKQSQSATLIEAIDNERSLLEPLRAQAHSIDTSNIPAHALRSWIQLPCDSWHPRRMSSSHRRSQT